MDRLQLVNCVQQALRAEGQTLAELAEAASFATALPVVMSELFNGNAEINGNVNKFEGMNPTVIVYDLCQHMVVNIVKQVTMLLGVSLPPLLMVLPCNAAAAFHMFASGKNNGVWATVIRDTQEEIAKGATPVEAFAKHSYRSTGKTVLLPGLPTKFDYEWWPHLATCPLHPEMTMTILPSYHALQDSATKGVILSSAAELEPVAVEALEAEIGKKVYMAGPQFPGVMWEGHSTIQTHSADDERVVRFLDEMKIKHGSRSVCYLSFGSAFFPLLRPELIRYIVHTLRQANTPFVFAYASGIGPVPEDLLRECEGIENGCLVRFGPQWAVLNHEATSFFITHCGSNSTGEAILAEVPIVSIPFFGDQAQYAALLTEVLHVGIDLKQTKTFQHPDLYNILYDGTVIVGPEAAIKKGDGGCMGKDEGEGRRRDEDTDEEGERDDEPEQRDGTVPFEYEGAGVHLVLHYVDHYDRSILILNNLQS
ncbi:hypothetical protein L202_04856 [Cryptococcus amylolentus CBS 6039]|uniref:UDP-glycosyltransferases domain-containing protein n=1 Tax=Cryptococcus amylolentus CBS 6039 TaxID=1295533 RepID=A0A1E3HMZ1_9TREE|nr:hypothetical protein L202_04856 [Cryptococcus amylolentus CBS 6039]ODN77713.1 hypothetical protein L202_04856 [Cryptococcus amylolentus CBS 6039]